VRQVTPRTSAEHVTPLDRQSVFHTFTSMPGVKTRCRVAWRKVVLLRPPLSNGTVHTCRAWEDDLSGWQDFFDSDDLGLPEGVVDITGLKQKPRKEPESVSGNCYGCGVALQADCPENLGFVDPDVYWKKRSHKHQNTILCSRCDGRLLHCQANNLFLFEMLHPYIAHTFTWTVLSG
jgi:hypothetical protein